MSQVIQIDEGKIREHLGEVVRSTVSELNQKIYAQIETWRNCPIEGNDPYVFLDGLWLKPAAAVNSLRPRQEMHMMHKSEV